MLVSEAGEDEAEGVPELASVDEEVDVAATEEVEDVVADSSADDDDEGVSEGSTVDEEEEVSAAWLSLVVVAAAEVEVADGELKAGATVSLLLAEEVESWIPESSSTVEDTDSEEVVLARLVEFCEVSNSQPFTGPGQVEE